MSRRLLLPPEIGIQTAAATRPARTQRCSLATLRLLAAGAIAIGLAACGGSGGGGNSGSSGTDAAALGDPLFGVFGENDAGQGGGGGGATVEGTLAFSQTVYPLVRDNCASCHAGSGPGFPHVAHPDLQTAYTAVVGSQKIDLLNPANSRLVLRMDPEKHYCWTSCPDDAATLETEIAEWAVLVGLGAPGGGGGGGDPIGGGGDPGLPPPPTIPADAIASATLAMADGAGAGGGRYEADVIALWTFQTGSGDTAFDTSRLQPAMDLQLSGAEWISGGGIEIQSGKALATAQSSRKLYDYIADPTTGSQSYSIEAWVVPANTTQEGPARIVTYSNGTSRRNFTLGQELYNYVFRNRSTAEGIGSNGTPALETAGADEDLQAVLQHVVVTFDPQEGRRIYVNGQDTGDVDEFRPGVLTNWNPEYTFVLGNETSDDRLWQGQLRLVAIHDQALTPAQIRQNYDAGANEQFLLRFGLDAWLEAGSYIEFQVSEFDAYSYLFCFPTLVTPNPSGLPVEGIRIAVNGVAPVMSQSFSRVAARLLNAQQQLSSLCQVLPKDRGPAGDQFTIFFEVLGSYEDLSVEQPPVVPPNDQVDPPSPQVAIRDFAQVNDTMAVLTGVDPLEPEVDAAFQELTQQLPGTSDIMSFVSSQQVAIFKLALEYCDALVDDPVLREDFFGPAFEFDAAVPTAFSTPAKRDLVVGPLVDEMIGVNLATQPTRAELQPALDGLLDTLTAGCDATTCPAERTRTVVKGACAAVLSSAAVQTQ